MVRIRSFVIGSVAVVLLVPFAATAQCDLFEPPIQCRARLQAQQSAEWQHAFEEWQEGMKRRAEYEQKIADARARFWATYPDKPGAEKARADFANYLREKDLSILRDNLAAPVLTDGIGRRSSTESTKALTTLLAGHPLDGGIRQSAMPEFEAWVNAVREKVFEGHTSNSTDDEFMRGFLSAGVTPSFFKALAAADKLYQAYLIPRDWWEFDNVKRVPAGYDAPDAYGTLMYYRWEKIAMPQAGTVYQTFARLVGQDAARVAAKQVRDAPKDAQGLLVVTAKPPVKTGPGGSQVPDYDAPMPDAVIGTWASPVTAMEILATRGNARTYLLFLLREQNENGARVDRTTQWTFAETAYNRLKLAFGEASVLDAAERVRTAKKRMTSNTVINQEAIGATRNAPTEAFQDILARKDPVGYVKIALLFSGNIDSAAALDGVYRKFLADHGESNVLAAAKRIAAGKPYFFYIGGKGALENEMARPTTADVTPAATHDSPVYLAWRDFSPGAKATYLDLKPGATEPTPANVLDRQTYQLRSISANDAQVWVTQVVYDPNGKVHPARDSEEVYPAKGPQLTPGKTGSETLTIKGKPMVTQWEQTQNEGRGCSVTKTIWRNDDVPGSVVRDRTDTACPGRNFIQDKWLESYEGARTRPAVARAMNAPSAPPPLASPPDPRAPRTTPQPSALATKTDDEIVHAQLNGFLTVVTLDTINLAQIKAGQTVRARLDLSSQLKTLVPAEAERLQSVMNDVEIRLKLTLAGLVVGGPRLNATVDSVSFRSQNVPVATYDRSQFMQLNTKLAQAAQAAGGRGPTPDAYWELPANTAMTLTTTNLRTGPDTNQAPPAASLPPTPAGRDRNDSLDLAQRPRNSVPQPPSAPATPPRLAAPAAAPPATPAPTVPPGTRIQATLLEPVDMVRAGDGDTFRAQTLGPIALPGGNALPQGAAIVLRFSRAPAPNMPQIQGVPQFVSAGLTLQSITINGQVLPVSSNAVARMLPAAATSQVRATYPAGTNLLFVVNGAR